MIGVFGSFLFALALLLQRVQESGAIPPAEFTPAAAIFGSLPYLLLVGVIMMLTSAWRSLRTRRRLVGALALSGTGLTLAAFWQSWMIVPGSLLLLLEAAGRLRLHALPVRETGGLKTLGLRLLDAVLILFPASLLMALGEFLFRTRGFMAAGILESEVTWPYLAAVSGFATLAATKAAAAVLGLLGGFAAGYVLLLRLRDDLAAQLQAWFLALLVAFGHLRLLDHCMNDEFEQIGLYPQVLAMTLAIAAFLAPFCGRLLKSTEGRLSELPRALAQIPGGSRGRRGLPVHLMVLGALMPLLYPQVQDYREQIFDCVALLAILYLTSLMIRLRWDHILRHLRIPGIIGVVLGFVAFGTIGQRPDLRLIAFEYSRFAALGTSAPWSRYFERHDSLGHLEPRDPSPYPIALDESRTPRPIEDRGRPPIILFIWDAARPDRMSVTGHDRETTPELERLAEKAVVFEAARSSATATTISVRNLLSGTYNHRYMLDEGHAPFLVKSLAERGYDDFFITVTGTDFNGISAEAFQRSWLSGPYLEHFHFAQFPNEDGLKPDEPKVNRLLDHLDRKLKNDGDLDGLFALVHLTGTHSPWRNANPLRDYGKGPKDRYDGEMFKLDALLGQTWEFLEEANQDEKVIFVVTADHGTGLGEHGRLAGFFPYEEQVRVPLILKAPGLKAARVREPVTTLDIAPTILELTGDPNWPGFGRSLLPLMAGEVCEPRPFVSFCAFQDSYAVYDPSFRYKLHYHRSRGYQALFDLERDPQEQRNLLFDQAEIAESLRRFLAGFLWEGRNHHGNPYHYRAWEAPR